MCDGARRTVPLGKARAAIYADNGQAQTEFPPDLTFAPRQHGPGKPARLTRELMDTRISGMWEASITTTSP